jgi:hypothetical protein
VLVAGKISILDKASFLFVQPRLLMWRSKPSVIAKLVGFCPIVQFMDSSRIHREPFMN